MPSGKPLKKIATTLRLAGARPYATSASSAQTINTTSVSARRAGETSEQTLMPMYFDSA